MDVQPRGCAPARPPYDTGVLLASHEGGYVAIAQPAHGWMCGQLGRAWGNERFGEVVPFEEVCLAAEQHDTDWSDWELCPTRDSDTGLPQTFATAPFTVHVELHTIGPRRLVTQSRYAALLVSLHHTSFFSAPGRLGRLGEGGRRIQSFLDANARLQAELRASLHASDDEIERNHRLVRTWDGLSHDLITGKVPRVRKNVRTADGSRVDLRVDRGGDVYTIEPWPFRSERVVVRSEGRLLEGAFDDERAMREALARAPWLDLAYELAPASEVSSP